MEASDQQPSGALNSPQEKEIYLSHKIVWPFLTLFGLFVMIIGIHKRTALMSSMSGGFSLTLAASDFFILSALLYALHV